MICQVGLVGLSKLTCHHREGGGYRCEVIGEHTVHSVGEHTIHHTLMGDGWACSAVDAMLR